MIFSLIVLVALCIIASLLQKIALSILNIPVIGGAIAKVLEGMAYIADENSVLADSASTYYDDVMNIDNVVVKQMDKSKVRIYVEGKNAKNTELIFVNSFFDHFVLGILRLR